jgi:hypothetical protein
MKPMVALSRFIQHDCSPGIASHLEIEVRSSVACANPAQSLLAVLADAMLPL